MPRIDVIQFSRLIAQHSVEDSGVAAGMRGLEKLLVCSFDQLGRRQSQPAQCTKRSLKCRSQESSRNPFASHIADQNPHALRIRLGQEIIEISAQDP